MSGVAIIRHLLASNADLTALVPASRITAGVLPLKSALPGISVTQISGQQQNNVAMASASYLVRHRVQVTVLAGRYPEAKRALDLVRAALPVSRGVVNGFDCQGVIPGAEGPDLYDSELLVHQQSQDYIVSFTR